MLREGHEVHGVVRGVSRGARLGSDVQLHRADVGDAGSIERALSDARPQIVIHFAEPIPVEGIDEAALKDAPARATAALLRAMERLSPVPLVYCSSAAVYGSPAAIPVVETAPLRPLTAYGEGKVRAESLAKGYATIGQPTVILRPGNLIGPRQRQGLAVSDFARQIVEIENGRRPPVLRHGRLDAERDFLDVRDLAEACATIVRAFPPGFAIFNVGSGRAVALAEILRILRADARQAITTQSDPALMRAGEVRTIALDTTRVREATGWSPAIPLERSLIDTLDYWRSS
jgi:GDP-4-dehydro-6-deoxy-D-mannose reductase